MNKISPIFYGSIEKTELKLINPQRFQEYLYTLNGKEVEITVAEKGRKRTNRSNRYLWSGVYKPLADHLGYTSEDIHELMKDMFSPKKEMKIGKDVRLVSCSTTELLTTGFSEYIEQIKKFGAEQGVIILDPEEVK